MNSNVAPIVVLDLTCPGGQELLWAILKSRKPLRVHMGIPCGTSSRARERPLLQHLLSLGLSSPKPLRDALNPLTLPGLFSRDSLRASQANALYELCVDITLWCGDYRLRGLHVMAVFTRTWQKSMCRTTSKELGQNCESLFWQGEVRPSLNTCRPRHRRLVHLVLRAGSHLTPANRSSCRVASTNDITTWRRDGGQDNHVQKHPPVPERVRLL